MRKITLFIDTSQSEKTLVSVENDIVRKNREQSRASSSQTLLPIIESLLKECGLGIQDITEINVNTGPGSYTGLRVGVAVANALGKLLGVPINGVKDSYIEPTYSS